MLYQSPFGTIRIEAYQGKLCLCDWISDYKLREETCPCEEDRVIMNCSAKMLDEYFEGRRTTFDIPIALNGTPFQLEVWNALMDIPYGATLTYGQIAAKIGRPKASRAVGGACHVNPVSIFVPCHRVVGSNGLTGYAGGLNIKENLLHLENRALYHNCLFM